MAERNTMTADHAYLIVAATLASGVAAGSPGKWTAECLYNEYVRIHGRVRLQDINPSSLGKGEKL